MAKTMAKNEKALGLGSFALVLVVTLFCATPLATAGSPEFDRFLAAFNEFVTRHEAKTGERLYTDVRDLGDGIVEIEVATNWSKTRRISQVNETSKLYHLWRAAHPTEQPLMVRIVEKDGRPVLSVGDMTGKFEILFHR